MQYFLTQAIAFSNSSGSYIPRSIRLRISTSSTLSFLMPKYFWKKSVSTIEPAMPIVTLPIER